MHTNPALGLFLLFVAGIASGAFALPMKFNRRWAWENTWFVWTVLALVLLPLGVTLATVPAFRQIYVAAGPRPFLILIAFGLGWGAAQAFFGLAVDALGVGLAFSIVPGISAALGSLIPLFHLHSDQMFHRAGIGTGVGVLMGIFGMCVCAFAGDRRQSTTPNSRPSEKRRYARGLSLAIFSGLGSASANLALAFTGPLMRSAAEAGANPLWTANVIWLPLMLGAAAPNLLYCLFRMRQNQTFARFFDVHFPSYYVGCLIMAVLWFGSISLYGIASMTLGSWGTIVGWPLFMSLIVITATISGLLLGEWKGSERGTVLLHLSGVGALIFSVFVLSAASQLI